MPYSISDACIGCTACVPLCPAGAISGQSSRLHMIDPHKCLDCGACGRICPVRAVMDDDMRRCRPMERSIWPKPVFDDEACAACGACITACPTSALDLEVRIHGGAARQAIPALPAPETCIACGFCVQACVYDAVELQTSEVPAAMNHPKME